MKINKTHNFNKLLTYIAVICSFFLVSACTTTGVVEEQANLPPAQASATQDSPPETLETEPEDLWQRMRAELTWQNTDNPRIDKERDALLRQSNYLPLIAERANYYLYYIVEEISLRDMPMELALLPVVESTLDPFAASYSGAAGLWQIMPRTGRHLGIEQSAWYDGRQSLRDSTNAALDYLQSLHDRFDGDWVLAVAAYNAGEGTISKARKANAAKGLGTDYWSLQLRRQAREYVPKIIAVTQIIATPEMYGLEIPHVPNAPAFEIAQTDGPLHFQHVAELAGVNIETLRALNPGQLRGSISATGPSELLLPVGTSDQFHASLARLDPDELKVTGQNYRVQSGDSLWRIARRFDTDVATLQMLNNLGGNAIKIGETLQIPGKDSFTLVSADKKTARDYRVRAGDSLYGIANRFKVSVRNLVAWNDLDPDDYLQPGQQLTLYPGGG